MEQILTTKARMDISWLASNETIAMSVRDLYQFSEVVAPYLNALLIAENLDETVVFDTTMEVRDHAAFDIEGGVKQITIDAYVTMWYIGHDPIENFAFLLNEALVRQNGLPTILQEVALLQPDAKDFLASVSSVTQDTHILYSIPVRTVASKSHTGLVVACVMLVLALVFVSSVLVWMAGGCPVLVKKLETVWSKAEPYVCYCCYSNDEEKDDSATTASGILGAVPSYDTADSRGNTKENRGMPAGFTPNRGVFREQDCDDSQILSPMSTNTDFSSSRIVPLGIASQSSLTYRSPEKHASYLKSEYTS